jgi:hypothetical protein
MNRVDEGMDVFTHAEMPERTRCSQQELGGWKPTAQKTGITVQ